MNYRLENTILQITNLELGYQTDNGYKPVLKNINLTEHDVVREGHVTGQSIAIIGRSGRGKSTFFKSLTGLVKPKSGQILMIDPMTNEAKKVKEGDIGYVDQKYTLFRHKTVKQMLMFALRNDKSNKETKLKLINDELIKWNLNTELNKYSCELSGGQRQRVSLLIQILSSNQFMVLDEPTSGLDLINIDKLKHSFKLIQERDELNTIIFSTHDINFAVEMADVIYIIGKENPNDETSTIVSKIDLKERGVAWTNFNQKHINIVKEIKEIMNIS